MGSKKSIMVFVIISMVLIFFSIGTKENKNVFAKESDFIIKDGVLKQYNGSATEIIIPKSVKTIGAGVFRENKLKKVTIPSSVKVIEDNAFRDCKKLTEIIIPDNVNQLGQSAFQGCSSLYRVELSGQVYIGMSAFEDCSSLKELVISDGINTISHYAFKNCSSLETLDLPNSIVFIGGGCFENCSNLETILFPTDEFFIGYKAFHNTLWMDNYEGDYVIINSTLIKYRGQESDITIPDNISVIGYGAFENCTFITDINIPMNIKEIGNSAFSNCTGLTEIVIPKSVTKIGAWAFYNCLNLEKITITKDVSIRRDSLEDTKWMKDYQGDFVILNGHLLAYLGTDSKVIIPDNVTTICTGAFRSELITEITIPKNVTRLDYAGFICENLVKVFFTNSNVNIEYEAFLECNKELQLFALGGTVEEYAKLNNIKFIKYGLNKSKVTLYLDGDNTTSLRINGVDDKVQWKSEDTSIAKVSSKGKVTALKVGQTKIYATVNGTTLTCEIKVMKPYLSKSTITISKGKTSRLNLVGTSSDISWSSSNSKVATVNSSGVITAIKAGKVTITATAKGKTYTCKVIVK